MTKTELLQKITLVTGLSAVHVCLIAFVLPARAPIQAHTAKLQTVTVNLIAETAPLQTQTSQLLSVWPAVVSSAQFKDAGTAPLVKPSESPAKSTKPGTNASSRPDLLGTYLPSSLMDRRPTPVSEPDMQAVKAAPVSGLPVKLRIFVDRFGKVVEVSPLSANPMDNDFVEDVIAMFRATAFLPGQLEGEEVSSYLDIELTTQLNVQTPPLIFPEPSH